MFYDNMLFHNLSSWYFKNSSPGPGIVAGKVTAWDTEVEGLIHASAAPLLIQLYIHNLEKMS